MKNYLFTSESVAPGHPDKICDQISDSILDAYLHIDPYSRVAVETLVTVGKVVLAGEIKSKATLTPLQIEEIVRQTIKEIGYELPNFHWQNVSIENLLHSQSPDIAIGVDSSSTKAMGAGDQGIMFGYACNETPVLMPAAIYYANRILENIFDGIKKGDLKGLGPDAKSQVTLIYENDQPVKAHSIVVSILHLKGMEQSEIRRLLKPFIADVFPNSGWMCDDENLYINPTGSFTIGGPESDTGLTGRKIIVDSYGGSAPHGGGAFSGKDPSKVDRSAAYMARHLAKNVVAAGIADKCTIQLAYAIGVAKPLAFYINTHNTGKINEEKLAAKLMEIIDLTPTGIIKHLGLYKPIYRPTATFGHFGREPQNNGCFSWEKIDLAQTIKID
jgi:S-adenosylmethionine synthetase